MGNKRFQTYFGIPIPPFKEPKFGSHSTTIRFVITGNIPSKKNNQQAVTVRRDAVDWVKKQKELGIQPSWEDVYKAIGMVYSKVHPNRKYMAFVERVRPSLIEQMQFWSSRLADKGLTFPIDQASMTLKLHFKNRYVTDTANKQQSIQDVLVDCGVIANDDYKSLNPIISKSAEYYEEIIYDIAYIALTVNLRK